MPRNPDRRVAPANPESDSAARAVVRSAPRGRTVTAA